MKNNSRYFSRLRDKLLIWLNIFMQIAFPIAASITPTNVIAKSTGQFINETSNVGRLTTKIYILKEGESAQSIAHKNNMSLESLHKLNQFRVFAHGFNHLQPGDELDIPLSPLPKIQWEDRTSLPVNAKSKENQEKKLAGLASKTGSFLSNSPNGDAVASMVRGMATNEATNSIQQWLSQFGTAKIQLDVDKDFSLENSELDLLVPLYERNDRLFFTQGSLHRTDDRMQSNLGFGFRWFNDDSMLGGNTFLDYDLSNTHARMGVGIEYWRDFLKFGANSYQRLTNWKDSKQLQDYQDRPANGWDIRAGAYLPSWPQLGGSLVYEQYYGDEVALFGKENRQKDPSAITAGVSYTPFPLLTFNLEQRKGSADSSDTRVGLQVNYQFGTPLDSQLSGDSVKAMRSLQGQRYDLVERNNNIILEYKKQEVIVLRTAEQVSGKELEKHSLDVSVTSKYGLDRIDWDAGALLANGGEIVRESSNHYSVILPLYQTQNPNDNNYIISAIAYDLHGNKSNVSKTNLLIEGVAEAKSGDLVSDKPAIKANGVETATLTLTVKDEHDNGIANLSGISLVQSGEPVANVSISGVSESPAKDGTYTATLSGTGVGKVTLVPKVGEKTFDKVSEEVTLTALSGEDVKSGDLVSDKPAIKANGVETATLTLTVKDEHDNGIANLSGISLVQSGEPVANVSISGVSESPAKDGTYTATLSGTGVGKVTLVPKVGEKTFDKVSEEVTLLPILMEVTLDKTKAKVGEEIKLTIKTKTSDGKPYPDVPITVKSIGAVNRQKKNEPITLKFNKVDSFKGNTGSGGELSIQLSDPKGFGVETKFDIQASFGGESESESKSVIFTVITSPDTDKANYWGHMTETLTAADGTVFKRPMLVREVEGFNVPVDSDSQVREEWSLVTYTDADHVLCRGKIGTREQVNSVSNSKPVQKHGWPLDLWGWTSTTQEAGQHWTGDYTKGTAAGVLADDNPGATALCIK